MARFSDRETAKDVPYQRNMLQLCQAMLDSLRDLMSTIAPPPGRRIEIGAKFMRLDAGDLRDCLHTQSGHSLPSIGSLPGDFQFLGNRRHLAFVAQAANGRINSSRHRDDPRVDEAASFDLSTDNVKQKWKEANGNANAQ